jgi:RNA polymerase sigma-70 factor (ECF subfamily)
MMVSAAFLSDEELLRRVADSDPAAYATLYERYRARLSRFLASFVNDHRKTEDLTQEVLLEVWKKARTYRGLSRVSTWILGIARFKALTVQRRQAEVLFPDAEATHQGEGEDPGGNPEEVLLQEEQARILRAALQGLSPSHREVLHLAYGMGRSGKEIAEMTGCPEPTVRTRMFNAKHRLRQLLLTQGVNGAA